MNMQQLMEQRRARIKRLTDQFQALAAGEDADIVLSVLTSCFLQAAVVLPDLRNIVLENVQRMERQIAAMKDLPPAEAAAAAFQQAEGHAFGNEDVTTEAANDAAPTQH